MNVLMPCDTIGGVWTYALDLARGLQPYGVNVTLASMGASITLDQRRELAKLFNVDLRESGYKLEWMDDPWEDVARAGEWLLDIEQDSHADVVHLNGFSHGSLPFNAPKIIVAHSCVVSWWEAVKGEPPPAMWSRYIKEVAGGLQSCDFVVAPTLAMLGSVQRNYRFQTATRVIPNGRTMPGRQPTSKEGFVLSAGRLWDSAKNVETLCAAAPSLNCPVYVAGDQTGPDGTDASVAGVTLLGKLSSADLWQWQQRASIYALPARYEPFGLSILEAAFAGCALVLGDIESLREVWGDAALYIRPDDVSALGEAILQLTRSEQMRLELGRRAERRAGRYSLERMSEQYWRLYLEMTECNL